MYHVLTKSLLFKDMPSRVLEFLAKESSMVYLRGGDILFEEADEADGLFVVVQGRLQARKDCTVVGEISPGETVGELALIQDKDTTRSLTVQAVRDTELIYVLRQTFEKMIAKYPDTLLPITRLIIQRYKSVLVGENRTPAISTLAIVPASDAVDLALFMAKLQEACGARSLVVETEWFETQAEASRDRLAFLHRLEAEHTLLIFSCLSSVDECSRFFLRQADRVIYVANGNSSPDLQTFSTYQQHDHIATWDLVLLYQDASIPPQGTSEWLENGNFHRWHHIALTESGHFSRLLRWLNGTAVGLALSGGGARGYAHIGFMRALAEADIPIDMVGGVSMGSVIGSEIAQGWVHKKIMDVTRAACTHINPLGDYSLPLVSLVLGRHLSKLLREHLGEGNIEDTWIPLFCQSCNLTQASVHVFKRGKIWRAVRASIAIPGVVSPCIYDGEVHVDGGTIDNLPVEAMKQSGVKKIIAVDISTGTSLKATCPDTDFVSPWMLIRQRFNKKYSGVPHIVSTLVHSSLMGSSVARKQGQELASHYVRINVDSIGMLDWKSLDEAVEMGYQQGKKFVSSLEAKPL